MSNLIPIEEVLVQPEITETRFSCDLAKCKGACCTLESEFGAPLLQEEVDKIAEILPEVLNYIPDRHRTEIETNGFYEIKENELLTRSINSKACVFVYFENGIAKCGIEKAYLDGKTDFKKPISCHLFPIRVSKFGGDVLRYERFNECTPALEKGKIEDVTILEFCEESLSRAYGKKWYQKLKEIIGK